LITLQGTEKLLILLGKKAEAAKKTGKLYEEAYNLAQCGKTLDLLKEGVELTDNTEDSQGGATATECQEDKKISDMNLAAAKTAESKITSEKTRLEGLKKSRAEALDGAKIAASKHKAAIEKANRLKAADDALSNMKKKVAC